MIIRSLVVLLLVLKGGIFANIAVYPDAPQYDLMGYDNCNMETNGEKNVVRHLAKGSNLIFDIGAHNGNWSKEALTVSPQAELYAFEPVEDMFKHLIFWGVIFS